MTDCHEGYFTSVKPSIISGERDEGCTVNEAPYLFYKRMHFMFLFHINMEKFTFHDNKNK